MMMPWLATSYVFVDMNVRVLLRGCLNGGIYFRPACKVIGVKRHCISIFLSKLKTGQRGEQNAISQAITGISQM